MLFRHLLDLVSLVSQRVYGILEGCTKGLVTDREQCNEQGNEAACDKDPQRQVNAIGKVCQPVL